MKIPIMACLVAFFAAVACTTEVPVTIEVEKPVTRVVPETVQVEVTREVDVTREVPITRIVEATRRIEVTRNVPVTREVDVTREVPVTREVEVTRQVTVTREVPVTRVVVETVQVPVTRTVQVTRQVHVTREVPVTRVVAVTRETGRPSVSDLCSDYPYIMRLVEEERNYWKVTHDIAQRTLSQGSARLRVAIDDLAWIDPLLTTARSNQREICGTASGRTIREKYEMKTWEGWSACVNIRNRANDLVLDESWDDLYPAIKSAAWDMINAYVDYCDNDYFDFE